MDTAGLLIARIISTPIDYVKLGNPVPLGDLDKYLSTPF